MRVNRAASLALVVLVVTACGEKSPPPDAIASGPTLVKAIKVSRGGTPIDRRYSGEVRARHESVIGFRVGGKMIERLVDAGAHIRPGQPLARLDPTDARLAAGQAEASAALAEADLQRARDLKAKNFLSQAALDARESAARATLAQARLAQNQAAYTTLTADAAGIVAAVLAEPGQVLAAGQGVLRLARDGEREVAIALPETEIGKLKVGDRASVSLWATDKRYDARVREIAPAADPATRTFAARISLAGAAPELPLGMSATVNFQQAGEPGIVVPLTAIFQQANQPAVWVINADRTIRLQVVSVQRYSDAGAVIGAGLAGGEEIVAAGAFKLAPGDKVQVAAP